jgi:hypothetical protein
MGLWLSLTCQSTSCLYNTCCRACLIMPHPEQTSILYTITDIAAIPAAASTMGLAMLWEFKLDIVVSSDMDYIKLAIRLMSV